MNQYSPCDDHANRQLVRLNLLLKGLDAGIWEWNIGTGEEWWSPRFYTLLGLAEGEMPPSYEYWLKEVLHPDDVGLVSEAVAQHLNHKKPYKLLIRQKHKTLGYRWFETQGAAQFAENGAPEIMVGAIFDCHETVETTKIREAHDFLLEEMSRMAKVGVWEYMKGDTSPKWSPEIYAIHEVPLDYDNNLANAIGFYAPEHIPILTERFEQALDQGIPFDVDLQIITAKGDRKWVRAIAKPIYNHKGEIVGLRGVFQDINQTKRQEMERAQSMRLLTSQNSRLQNFAHIVSHNLRSHSGNIETLINFLATEKDPFQQAQILGMLKQTSKLLHETLENLNEVVRLQAQVGVQKVEVDLELLTRKTVALLQQQIDNADADVNFDFSAGRIVLFDPVYAESVLLNLLTNALKYRNHAVKCRILVSTSLDNIDGRLILLVKDNGLGMDLDRVGDKLFGMYKTFHHNPEARGLGLFITKNQVDSLGGEITVTSKPDLGTTFAVKF